MKCNICSRNFKTQAALQQHRAAKCGGARPQTNAQPRPRRRRNRTIVTNRPVGVPSRAVHVVGDDSTLTVTGEELAYVLTQQANSETLSSTNRSNFWPGGSGMTRLDQYGRMFEQYRVNKLEYHYRTSSGTTISGATLTAFDYEASDYPASLGSLQVRQPRIRLPVWENGSVRIDPARANKSRWMFTAGGITDNTPGFTSAGIVVSSAPGTETTTEYGEVWCCYSVTFTGPTTSNAGVPLFANSENGVWNTTPKGNFSDSFVIHGNGTTDLKVQPTHPGEYLFQFSAPWTTEAAQTVIDQIEAAVASAGNSVKFLSDVSDYPKVIQAMVNSRSLPPTSFTLPATLAALGYRFTAFRSAGGSPRV